MADSPTSNWSSSFLISSANHAIASAANSTSFLKSSPRDLFLLIPRIIAHTGFFAFVTVPEKIDHMLGLGNGGRFIAEATGDGLRNFTTAALSGAKSTQESVMTIADGATGTESTRGSTFGQSLSFQQVRNFGGVFTYMTSKWALMCLCFVSLE